MSKSSTVATNASFVPWLGTWPKHTNVHGSESELGTDTGAMQCYRAADCSQTNVQLLGWHLTITDRKEKRVEPEESRRGGALTQLLLPGLGSLEPTDNWKKAIQLETKPLKYQ